MRSKRGRRGRRAQEDEQKVRQRHDPILVRNEMVCIYFTTVCITTGSNAVLMAMAEMPKNANRIYW